MKQAAQQAVAPGHHHQHIGALPLGFLKHPAHGFGLHYFVQVAFGQHVHQVARPDRAQHGAGGGAGLFVVGHVHHVQGALIGEQQPAQHVLMRAQVKGLPIDGQQQAFGRIAVPAHGGHYQQREGRLAQQVQRRAGHALRRVGGGAGAAQHQQQRVVAVHGFPHGVGQEIIGNVHFGGHGLPGRQLPQRLRRAALVAPRMAVSVDVGGQQIIVAHVQQHQVSIQRHGQPGGVGKGAVGNGEKIGENDEGRSQGLVGIGMISGRHSPASPGAGLGIGNE